jgi:hypothetical protein
MLRSTETIKGVFIIWYGQDTETCSFNFLKSLPVNEVLLITRSSMQIEKQNSTIKCCIAPTLKFKAGPVSNTETPTHVVTFNHFNFLELLRVRVSVLCLVSHRSNVHITPSDLQPKKKQHSTSDHKVNKL